MEAARSRALAATLAVVALSVAALARAADRPCPAPAHPGAPVAIGTAEWNGWGRDDGNSRYQPEPALRATDVPKLALRWAYALAPARSYAQPTVVGGRVFVTSSTGWVYSLDARRGCTYWTYDAAAPIDTPVVIGALGKPVTLRPRWRRWHWQKAHIRVIEPPSAAIFGDAHGTVTALDASRGTVLWRTALGDRLHGAVSGAPVADDGRVYVPVASPNGGAGSLVALDLSSGAILWQSPPLLAHDAAAGEMTAPTSPTIDANRHALYVAIGDTGTLVALNLADGTLRWVGQGPPLPVATPPAAPRAPTRAARRGHAPARRVPAKAGARSAAADPPILQSLANGRQVLLTASAAGVVEAFDPDRGTPLWRTPVLSVAGGVEWSHAADHRKVYVSAASRVPQAGRDNAVIAAIDLATGALRWRKAAPQPLCASAQGCDPVRAHAITVIPGIVFCGSRDGHLRAYSTIDGMSIWDFDAARELPTVNDGPMHGGPLDRDGPTIVNGMAFADAVDRAHGEPAAGLVLAFSVDAK
ncbi:MAG: PQQ-binding-like beta-propeller repeat protein [Gammaproteobacteria bacterium]|nr:PQQ-binding-like beta-propeller repeat protein [Gammaproteobacteria bacterium]